MLRLGHVGTKIRLWRMLRFLVVGLLNTAFGYAAYALLLLSGASLWFAVAGATILALVFNFLSYGNLVFDGAGLRALPRFLAFYCTMGLINFALLRMLTIMSLTPLLAQAVLLPILAVIGYAGMTLVVFRERSASASKGDVGER